MHVQMLLFMHGHLLGGERVSPKGRPTADKRDKRFEIRLSESTYKTLEECSKAMNVTKAEVIHKGIALVKTEVDKQKK